jgi:hypothetical protein
MKYTILILVFNLMNPYIDGGAQFRGRRALPSQAQEGSLLSLNWTTTIIPRAQHMFHESIH